MSSRVVHHCQLTVIPQQRSSFGAKEPVPKVHGTKTHIVSEYCKVGYSTTLVRSHLHNFICSENRCLRSPGDLCREFIADDLTYHPNVVQ